MKPSLVWSTMILSKNMHTPQMAGSIESKVKDIGIDLFL